MILTLSDDHGHGRKMIFGEYYDNYFIAQLLLKNNKTSFHKCKRLDCLSLPSSSLLQNSYKLLIIKSLFLPIAVS